MIYAIHMDEDGFFVVTHNGTEISKKKTLLQATKALASFEKGRN